MSPKMKIIVIGLGLVGINVVAFALVVAWPVDRVEKDPAVVVHDVLKEEVATTSTGVKVVGSDVAVDAVSTSRIPSEVSAVADVVTPLVSNERVGSDIYTVPVHASGTVLDAMRAFQDVDSETFSFEGRDFPGIGMFIETINGKKAADEHYWILYVNGKTADLGVSQARVRPGDVVEWRYEESMY